MADRAARALDETRRDAGLSQQELWIRYFGLGGMTPALELEAIVCGALHTSCHDRDVLVHALNERFTELGRNHPLAYSDDGDPAPRS